MMEENRNATINQKLFRIRNGLSHYKKSAVEAVNSKTVGSYGDVIGSGFQIFDLMLEIIVLANTILIVEEGMVKDNASDGGRIIFDYCYDRSSYAVPPKVRTAIESTWKYRILYVNESVIDEKDVLDFTEEFDRFTEWFYKYIIHKEISVLDSQWGRILNFSIKDNIEKRINVDRLEEHFDRTERMETTLNEVDGNVREISRKLEEISNQITSYQSFVTGILESGDPNDETDMIMHERLVQSLADAVSDRIVKDIASSSAQEVYSTEERKLINTLGKSAWKKLSQKSRTFLITSKVMFNELLLIEGQLDFSGVCILVTKALEEEAKKRFYFGFTKFLKGKYGSDLSKYHTALLFRNTSLLKQEKFTMGSIPFAMGFIQNKNDNPNQISNNDKVLVEYVKSELMPNSTDVQILSVVKGYGKDIDKIRKDYRNPSAHTNELGQKSAQECFNFVIDVEALLKNMLDSFVK